MSLYDVLMSWDVMCVGMPIVILFLYQRGIHIDPIICILFLCRTVVKLDHFLPVF